MVCTALKLSPKCRAPRGRAPRCRAKVCTPGTARPLVGQRRLGFHPLYFPPSKDAVSLAQQWLFHPCLYLQISWDALGRATPARFQWLPPHRASSRSCRWCWCHPCMGKGSQVPIKCWLPRCSITQHRGKSHLPLNTLFPLTFTLFPLTLQHVALILTQSRPPTSPVIGAKLLPDTVFSQSALINTTKPLDGCGFFLFIRTNISTAHFPSHSIWVFSPGTPSSRS